jgi:kynureninase
MNQTVTLEDARRRDRGDPLRGFRARFLLPEGVIYVDGNSLGALPRVAVDRARAVVEREWGQTLIESWNDHGWIDLPLKVGGRIAGLIGADPDEVIACDSVSVNLFKTMSAALGLRPGRTVIVTSASNFPTDIYIAEGLAALLGGRVEIRLMEPEEAALGLTKDVAAIVYSHVNYRTARIEDMAAVNRAAQASGALTIWDLSHSAGALPVALNETQADFAVGCTYKYLNGGPGAPAFVFAARRHHADMRQPLSGWLGHARPFAFDGAYVPAPGIRRMLSGTFPVIGLSIVDEAVKIVAEAGLDALRAKSVALTELLVALVRQECGAFGLILDSPEDPALRGSHVIFRHPEGYAIVQALKARGVIGDFRAPDCIRLGIAPLYQTYEEIWQAVGHLRAVLEGREWDRDAFRVRAAVT